MHIQPPNPSNHVSPHIRFAPLPIPDHATGHITYNVPSPPAFHLRWPAFGIIAQRRVLARDDKNERLVREDFQLWREDRPQDKEPTWEEVRWTPEPHPGIKVSILLEEGLVSPTTNLVSFIERYGRHPDAKLDELPRTSDETFEYLLESMSLRSPRSRIGCCCEIQ